MTAAHPDKHTTAELTTTELMTMTKKHQAAEGPIGTAPFDIHDWIATTDQAQPGFAAAVEAELAALRIEEQLRDLRKSQKITQAQLAKRMGVSQSQVAQIESATAGRVEVRTLAKMATALGYGMTIDFEPRVRESRSVAPRRAARKAAKR